MTEQGIVVVGGGIAGLALALSLHQRGIACDVYESVPQVKELGVGITLLPHGMRELSALGVQPQLEAVGIEIHRQGTVKPGRTGRDERQELLGRRPVAEIDDLGTELRSDDRPDIVPVADDLEVREDLGRLFAAVLHLGQNILAERAVDEAAADEKFYKLVAVHGPGFEKAMIESSKSGVPWLSRNPTS